MSAQPEVRDSHYVPKFLLRNWETASNNLRYFDFTSGRIHKVRAKSMYVSRDPFSDQVEKWLGRVIESPAGDYVARAKKARAASVPDPPTPAPREWQALILLLITQFYRTAEAHEGPDSRFSDMATKDDAHMAALVARCREDNELLLAYSPKESLYFPSLGFAPIPVVLGTAQACFLPLTPTLFVGMVGRDTDGDALARLLKVDGLVSAFSVGLVGDKVVLPPLAGNADLKAVAAHVRVLRGQVHELCTLQSALNRLNGRRRPLDVTEIVGSS